MKQSILKVILTLFISFSLIGSIRSDDNYIKTYADFGYHNLYNYYGGVSAIAQWKVVPFFQLKGGMQLSSLYSTPFGAVMADGTFIFPLAKSRFLLSNLFMYRLLSSLSTQELLYRLALTWESNFVDITLGNSFRGYFVERDGTFEPFNLSYNLTVRVRPAHNPWNIALSIRNHDDFEYDILQSVRFGLQGSYRWSDKWTGFAEYVLHPHGNFNLNANWYNMYGKIGVIYKW